jgi:hypothetical protein
MFRILAISTFVAAAACAASFTGPTSVYYLGDSSNIYRVQGLNLLSQWAVQNHDLPMAVDSTVRTNGNFQGQLGSQYSLTGTYTGTTYANSGYAGGGMDIWDGTTDLSHNYTVTTVCGNCATNSSLIQTDLDWSNPVVLFNLGGAYDSLGVTFDFTDNTLWTSNWNGAFGGSDTVSHYTLGGTLLGSFETGFTTIGALALDPADNTLWMTSFGSSTLFQFSKSGTLLQSGTIAGLTATTLWSGEFTEQAAAAGSGVPEPETWPLFGAGIGMLVWLRRRRATRA